MIEINRQGNNINQIARHLNTGGKIDPSVKEVFEEVQNEYRELKKVLYNIAKKI